MPDPNCKDCKGTGVIKLFTSSKQCECTKNDGEHYEPTYDAFVSPDLKDMLNRGWEQPDECEGS